VTRPAGIGLALAFLLVTLPACDFGAASESPSTSASVAASPSSTPSPEPTPTPQPTTTPTPDQADVPIFQAGALVAATTNVRLRDLPGTRWGIAANLPRGAVMQVVLGPIRTAGFGWYLVRDADSAAPSYQEGWVAAGYQPDPFLAAKAGASPPPDSPTFVAGYQGTKGGEFGPFSVEGSTALRWTIAVPIDAPDGTTCRFSGSLAPQSGQAITFLKASAAQAPAPGTVQPAFFASHPTLHGGVSLHVDSDCSWAVTVVRLPI
jgi:hypothetical protein